jgi:hypothetical protein
MLCRGATPYDVAKVFGDTIETVEQHCDAPFVPELRGACAAFSNRRWESETWAETGLEEPQVQ